MADKPNTPKPDRLRLIFQPYDLAETKDEAKPSAVAFAELRAALKSSEGKPDAPEEAGSWERTAQLHLFFSRGEHRHEQPTGQFSIKDGVPQEVKVPVLVLDPAGYQGVLPSDTVTLLRSIWRDHMKTRGTRANALRIFLTNEWLGEFVVDASAESALASGAVSDVPGSVPGAPPPV